MMKHDRNITEKAKFLCYVTGRDLMEHDVVIFGIRLNVPFLDTRIQLDKSHIIWCLTYGKRICSFSNYIPNHFVFFIK